MLEVLYASYLGFAIAEPQMAIGRPWQETPEDFGTARTSSHELLALLRDTVSPPLI